jgi:hypothetical protein
MTDYVTRAELLSLVEEIFDKHTLMSEVPVQEFKSGDLNYNKLKSLICNKILQLMLDIDQDNDMSEIDKFVLITSSMATLAAENFVLWNDKLRG